MKNLKCRTAVIFLISAVISLNAKAQPTREYATGRFFITIDNNSAPVTNVSYLDLVGPDFGITHSVSFDIGPSDEKSTMELINKIQSGIQKKTLIQCVLTAVDFDYNITWDRTYDETKISEISFDNLDASSKEALNMHVRFSSVSMRTTKGGGKYKSTVATRMNRALSSNFKLTLGNLPADKVSSISNLRITSQNDYVTITLKVSAVQADQWYNEMVANAQTQKTLNGVITLLTPDMKGEFLKINLTNVQIVSYGSPVSSGGDNIARITIGLKTNDIHF